MSARLPAALESAGLRRLAEAQGGSAMVLAKGDPDRGAITLLIRERGAFSTIYERQMDAHGDYVWHQVGPSPDAKETEISHFCDSRRRNDPDLWLIELDIPQVERFVVNLGLDR